MMVDGCYNLFICPESKSHWKAGAVMSLLAPAAGENRYLRKG